LALISTPTARWLQVDVCVRCCPPFRLRVPHDLDHTCWSDDTRPPWVTHASSPPCRPHTPWYDGEEPNAFAPIVRARPFPIFGRPVHPRDGSRRLQPGGSPQALQTLPHGRRPALRRSLAGGSRSPLAVSGFRLRARVGFSIPSCPSAGEALPPPLDINPGSRVEWDFNPPDTCAARHTPSVELTKSPHPPFAKRG
jgi:hypothetical protein